MNLCVKIIGKWKAESCSGCGALNQFCVYLQIGASRNPRARTASLCPSCMRELRSELAVLDELEKPGGDFSDRALEASSGPVTAPVVAPEKP